MAKVYIGTSGWQYKHWKGVFYPKNLPIEEWLKYYAQHFNTVEINSTFYHQIKPETYQKWREKVGKNFVFSIKGHRYITHIKRLKEASSFARAALVALQGQPLLLWQLPPNFKQDLKRLENFLKQLPKGCRYAFEFRHKSWANDQTWELLRKYNTAAVFQDWNAWPVAREITADFIYIRFHGNKFLYSSSYSQEELKSWAKNIKQWQKEGLDVYAYFNNDAKGYAVSNALALSSLLGKEKDN